MITLSGVNDATSTGSFSVPMGILLADTLADSVVDSADIMQTRRQSGQVTAGRYLAPHRFKFRWRDQQRQYHHRAETIGHSNTVAPADEE